MTSPPQKKPDLDSLVRLCTAQQMRRLDENAIHNEGIPGRKLMENAAMAVVHAMDDIIKGKIEKSDSEGRGFPGLVTVCCGAGNNGGDGYALARLLTQQGWQVQAVSLGKPTTDDAKANQLDWESLGPTYPYPSEKATRALEDAAVIVDALFGTGLTRELSGDALSLVSEMNASPAPWKVGVDIPSGICADTGRQLGGAVQCTHTVTFQLGKIGLFQPPGSTLAGEVSIMPISIPVLWENEDPQTYLLDSEFIRSLLPVRPASGHKGTFGHVLTLCGSAGMGGAALLASKAALKSGAGLVTAGVPKCLRDGFLAAAPELMTLSTPEAEKGAEIHERGNVAFYLQAAATRSAIVLGCGLGQAETTREFTRGIVQELDKPLVIDADGLNLLDIQGLKSRIFPTVITPHPGELARLAGLTIEEINGDRIQFARKFAQEWNVIIVLKGSGTVIAEPNSRVYINPTGDEGLASGGTGDVLAGMIGGLLAQGLTPLDAALVGVYWHGLSRDCLKDILTAQWFTASDLIDGMNDALLLLQEM